MTVTTYKWSIDEWHQLVNSGVLEGKSVELLSGEIISLSPEKPIHSSQIVKAAEYIRTVIGSQAQIRESHPITLDDSEPEPDIAIVCYRDDFYSEVHPLPQDIYWLVEISNSTLKFDLEIKSKVYARNSITEYWVIDLVNKKLIVHTQPIEEVYTQIQELTTGIIAPQAFPQITIPLDKLLLA